MRTLSPTQARLLAYLEAHCRGREHAIKNRPLAQAVGLQERTLRAALSRLARTGNFGIGSFDGGVYLIENAADYQAADACLAEESFPTLERQRALKRWWESQQTQLSLFQGGY